MDYEIWIDVSKVTPGGWIGLVAVVLAILWSILVLVKLWITWDNAREDREPEPEPMEMDNVVDPTSGRLYIVDRTEGQKVGGGSKS